MLYGIEIVEVKSNVELKVGDSICRGLEEGNLIDQAFVINVSPDNHYYITVYYLDNRSEGHYDAWELNSPTFRIKVVPLTNP